MGEKEKAQARIPESRLWSPRNWKLLQLLPTSPSAHLVPSLLRGVGGLVFSAPADPELSPANQNPDRKQDSHTPLLAQTPPFPLHTPTPLSPFSLLSIFSLFT